MITRILTALLIFTLFSPAALAREQTFNAEHFTLDNGLEIVVIPNHRAPVVTHMVWYKTGAADEPRGKSGIAHFLEHLMFKGSGDLGPGEFSKKVRAMGGNDNAFTNHDYTAYFQSISKDYLETVMQMEAQRMRSLYPPLEHFLSERDVILEERRQRIDNDPQAKFNEQLQSALYVNHPYGISVIGWAHEIEALSWEDAKNFYDHWYGPNNAILVVAGDVTGQEVYDLAQKTYGALQPVDVPARNWIQSPPLPAKTKSIYRDPTIKEPSLRIQIRVPSAAQDKEQSLALEVLQEILGGGSTSVLYQSLVTDQKLASSAGLSYRANRLSDAQITLYASPLPGVTLEALQAEMENTLRAFIETGVSDDALESAKARLENSAIYARDSLSGPAMIFGQALSTGSSIDDVEYWPDDIAAVTAQQVNNAARAYLDPDSYGDHPPVIGYLLPAEEESAE